jgi:GAF domain-containing protein/HAMP domain-containing protein
MTDRIFSAPNESSPKIRHSGFWKNLRLARKLLLAFGALFIFAVIIAAVTLSGLNRTQIAYENALAHGIEIRKLSDQLEVSLLHARFDEKSSILHWQEEGLDTAFTNYVTSYTHTVAEMRENLKQLALFNAQAANATGNFTQALYEADIASLNQNVDSYENSFTALVDAFQKKGTNKNTDFESKFRIAASNIEAKINGQDGLVQLELTVISLRRSERFYLDQGKQLYVDEVQTSISQLRSQIAETAQLEPAAKSELLIQVDAYQNAFDALVGLDKEIATYNEELGNRAISVESLAGKIKTLGEQLATKDINTARSNYAQTFRISIITVLFVLVLSILLAVTFSRQLTRPIISLTGVAKEISAGKFNVLAQVDSGDEIGILAQTINNMTSRLQAALQNLDHRTKELEQQTVQLELTSQQNEKRANQLQTMAEIARYISMEKDLNKLLPLITQTVSEQFGLYHVGVFLLDEVGKFATLFAANSAGGKSMLARGHRLKVGEQGIVGYAAQSGKPRIALNVEDDIIYFNNPDLPLTRSEMALPLKIENRVIGVLDIQSTDINAFSGDIEALATLADQISHAIENARLFNQIEKSLSDSNAIQHQFIRETWGRLPKEEKLHGFRYSAMGASQLDEDSIISADEDTKDKRGVSVPIILRGETIGTLSVQVPKSERVGTDQMDLIKAVAERVALSAENARLFDETTRRAERERIVSDIASKIGTSVRTESILRTTATELSQLLEDADIFIDLNTKTTHQNQKETE